MMKRFKALSLLLIGGFLAFGAVASFNLNGKNYSKVNAISQLGYTLNTSIEGTNNNYASNCDIKSNNITWNVTGNSTVSPWRIGGKKITNTIRRVYSKDPIGYNINKVEINFGADGGLTVNSVTLNVYSTASLAATGGTGDKASFNNISYSASSKQTVSKTDSVNWSNCFYSIDVNCTNTTNSNKYISLCDCLFYYESSEPATYTVAFNANGHGTAPASQTNIPEGGKVTKPEDPTEENYVFGGWYKESACANAWDFTNDTVNANITLYAKWTGVAATISFDANGATSGTAPASIASNYNEKITLPDNGDLEKTGFIFAGWNTLSDGSGTNYNAGATYTITSTTTLYARWNEMGATYKLVTDASKLYVGDIICIASNSSYEENTLKYVLSTTQNTNNRGRTPVDYNASNYTITATEAVQEIVIGKSDDYWTLGVSSENYLCCTDSTSNHLRTTSDISNLSKWSISINDSIATIKACYNTNNKYIKYNASSNIFSCYASGQGDICIFKKVTAVGTFAEKFIDSGLCDNGVTAPSKSIWTTLQTDFSVLTSDQQNVFKNATGSETGTSVEQCVIKYDYIISKYGTTEYSNFMTRSISSSLIFTSLSISNNSKIIPVLISTIAILGSASFGVLLILKRKKKEN